MVRQRLCRGKSACGMLIRKPQTNTHTHNRARNTCHTKSIYTHTRTQSWSVHTLVREYAASICFFSSLISDTCMLNAGIILSMPEWTMWQQTWAHLHKTHTPGLNGHQERTFCDARGQCKDTVFFLLQSSHTHATTGTTMSMARNRTIVCVCVCNWKTSKQHDRRRVLFALTTN